MPRHLLALLFVGACAPDITLVPKDDDPEDPVDSDPAVEIGQPDIEIDKKELRFGAALPGCDAPDQVFVITNVGDADLAVKELKLRGPDSAVYVIRDSPRTLKPGGSLEVAVGFTPAALQKYGDALIEVNSNDPDEASVRVDLEGAGDEFAYIEEIFEQGIAGPVDVLFSIDYSGSMSTEISALGNKFQTFITSFQNLGLDYQIAVITADPSCATFQGTEKIITPQSADPVAAFLNATSGSGCGGEAAFGASKNALTSPLIDNENKGFLRADATLAVVALSDEPEQSGQSANQYVNWLASLKGGDASKVSFSGIVGPDGTGIFPVCRGEVERAPEYHKAIRQSGGVWGNICNLDLVPFLTHLSYVAAGLNFSFELANVPSSSSPSAITVTIDGVVIPYGRVNGWVFDEDTNSVELFGTAIPEPGASIVVAYPYDSGC